MTGAERRRSAVLVALLLVVVAAGLGPARAVEHQAIGSKVAVSAAGPGLQPAGLVDTRLQRSGATDQRDPTSRPHGFACPGPFHPGPSAPAAASAVAHGADRPGRARQVCLRGPPGLPA